MTLRRDWLLQASGVIVGVAPAVFASYLFIPGLLFFLLVAGLLMLLPRLRAFGYGFACAVLVLPGLLIALWP